MRDLPQPPLLCMSRVRIWLSGVGLFLRLVWRPVEPRGGHIPDPYRSRDRVGVRLAWSVAAGVTRNLIASRDRLRRLDWEDTE